MKNKDRNKRWPSFFTNLLGVILGIVLTFGVNSLWQKHEDQKRIKEMLILVRNELEINKEFFKGHEKAMKKDKYVYKKIMESKENLASISHDTIYTYFLTMRSSSDQTQTTASWRTLQNSEIIQKITNKELIIRLTECYWLIEKAQEIIMSGYWDKKKKASNVFEFDPYLFFEEVMENKESVFFYTLMSEAYASFGIWRLFPMVDAYIDYTIMVLDKHGDYKYDMDDRDKEVESFVAARIDSVINSKIEKADTIQKIIK